MTNFSYSNPVVRGNAPDPSVIRVGEDYYLVTSSFEYLPGLVIRHSTDLVDWAIIGTAVTRPAQYRRDGKPGRIMLFAATIRYHAGRFYVACTNTADSQGNFIVHTDDPAGDWSDAVWVDQEAFDPSLFFEEDGTCYYTRRTINMDDPEGNLGPVVQATIDPLTGALGDMRPITPGPRGFQSNDIEGPHLYRIGEWYYLFAAEGSTWIGHMQTVARSRSPWGPFEPAPHNPVISHRDRVLHPIQTLGHADLVEDPSGGWWALALGTRHNNNHHNLGRETFLMPVSWRDGWPYIGNNGGTELNVAVDGANPTTSGQSVYSPHSLAVRLGWHQLGHRHFLVDTDGSAWLQPGEALGYKDVAKVGAAFRYQTEDDQSMSATTSVSTEGPKAGICIYSGPHHFYEMSVERLNERVVRTCFRRHVDDLEIVECVEHECSGPIRLSVHADRAKYAFSVASEQGSSSVGSGSARLMSAEVCEWFVGANFGLLCYGEGPRPHEFTDVQFY